MILSILVPISIIPQIYYPNYNILKLIVLLIGGLALLIALLIKYKELIIDKKDIILLIFIGLIFISTCFSSDIKKSIIGEKNSYEGMIMFCIYACIYISTKKHFEYCNIKTWLNIMFYVSVLIAILGIIQKNIINTYWTPIFGKGICGTFGNSNFFGSYISIVLPIALSIFILYGNKKSFLLTVLMFFNLISSGTRSAWVAFAVISILGIIYLIKNYKNKAYFKRAILISIIFTIIGVYLFNTIGYAASSFNRLKNDINNFKDSGFQKEMGSYRIDIWEMTFELLKNKIIIGSGPDNLKNGLIENCPEEIMEFINNTNTIVDKVHNEYLHIAATIGLPALIIYVLFLILIILPRTKIMFKDNISFIIILTIISYLVQAFFNISTIGVAPLFWMILGICDNKMIKNIDM